MAGQERDMLRVAILGHQFRQLSSDAQLGAKEKNIVPESERRLSPKDAMAAEGAVVVVSVT